MPEIQALPDGFLELHPAEHFQQLRTFTLFKGHVGEPSPHLAMMGMLVAGQPEPEKVWRLACYAAAYSLPTAMAIYSHWSVGQVQADPAGFGRWLTANWKGIITRTERRCVRTAPKMERCLLSANKWIYESYPIIKRNPLWSTEPAEYYEFVWKSVDEIYSFGRYISIRFIEGLRRYCGVPAMLGDIRSMGGWSPKKCLAYFYPEQATLILTDSRESDKFCEDKALELMGHLQKNGLPDLNFYVMAAMLCEYREAFEDRHQYPGWTIDQEPLLFAKVKAYWGDDMPAAEFWAARRALFPAVALAEANGWAGTRWELTKTLRDHNYVFSDIIYDYNATLANGDWADPVQRASA